MVFLMVLGGLPLESRGPGTGPGDLQTGSGIPELVQGSRGPRDLSQDPGKGPINLVNFVLLSVVVLLWAVGL